MVERRTTNTVRRFVLLSFDILHSYENLMTILGRTHARTDYMITALNDTSYPILVDVYGHSTTVDACVHLFVRRLP